MALQTAEALFTHVFRHYRVPEDIVSDRGPQFTSGGCLWNDWGSRSASPQVFTPRVTGRWRDLTRMWVGFCGPIAMTGRGSGRFSAPGQRWPKTPSATNLSPFQCVLGYQPVLALWHQSQIEAPAVDEWFRHLEETWDAAHVHLQPAIRRQKASANCHRSETPVYARVWISTRNLPLRLPCWKLGLWPVVAGPLQQYEVPSGH
uniref:uncharacterized protein LOC124042836 n=1 Tax=Oncorhynchus gorbuscha TaxID=8017 RepID=UPI001EAE9268|nr:uncharacterized protein LOC124042836 [Oncorhynchus gorbuscha]